MLGVCIVFFLFGLFCVVVLRTELFSPMVISFVGMRTEQLLDTSLVSLLSLLDQGCTSHCFASSSTFVVYNSWARVVALIVLLSRLAA